MDQAQKVAKRAINRMLNTGLHPVITAHMLVGTLAEEFCKSDPAAANALHRIGYHLCLQERDIAMGVTR